jgi:hypothetical protein
MDMRSCDPLFRRTLLPDASGVKVAHGNCRGVRIERRKA